MKRGRAEPYRNVTLLRDAQGCRIRSLAARGPVGSVGNTNGIAKIDDRMTVKKKEPEAKYYFE